MMRKFIDIIAESNHCNMKPDDFEGDVCPSCGMHREWHEGLDDDVMERSHRYAHDVKARGEQFAKRKLSEATRPTRMKTATDDMTSVMPQVDIDHGGAALAPMANPTSTSVTAPPVTSTASAEKTRAAVQRAVPDIMDIQRGHTGNVLRDLQNNFGQVTADEFAAQAAYLNPTPTTTGHTEPRPPENLPVVIQQAVTAGGDPEIDTTFNPDWHQVRNLPGNMLAAIRQMAGHVFREFTNTPTDDIQMMCDLLNPKSDVRKMAGWIVRNGVKVNEMTIDFSETLPGYAAMAGLEECNLYNVEGYQFLVMRDRGGHYIYGWPADDSRLTNPQGMDAGPGLNAPARQIPSF